LWPSEESLQASSNNKLFLTIRSKDLKKSIHPNLRSSPQRNQDRIGRKWIKNKIDRLKYLV